MESAKGRFDIVFNGEIYNYRDLKEELHAGGAEFRGSSDTEVILAAVERWGLHHAVTRMVGMFAFALWDRERRALHLVRDRFGEKPLYYASARHALVFGSELKAIRAYPGYAPQVDRRALSLLLRFGYVPAPYSIYEGVAKVRPGTILTFTSPGPGSVPAEVVYWSARAAMEAGMRDPLDLPEDEIIDAAEARLQASIAREMVADVPVGAFLSGGIDSSLITALMQRSSARPVKTFTIGFDVPGFNEAEHARRVAEHLGTEHTEMYVSPADALDVIPSLPTLYDEPFADPSQIPTYLVAKLARRDVTVALSGDGGDELFAGYNRYFWGERLWRRLRHVPRPLRRAMARAMTAITPARWDAAFAAAGVALPAAARFPLPGDRMHKLAGVIGAETDRHLYHALVSHWREPEQVVIDGPEHPTAMGDPAQWPSGGNFVDRMMLLDAISYLPDDILVKVDRATMGVSLEARAPFLDHEVAEFAWRVPQRHKIRDGQGKWLLRQVLFRHVPRELIERPKMGFGVPIAEWLRGELRDWAEALLDPARLQAEGFLDATVITHRWHEHLSGARNWQYPLWNVLMFQAWHEAQREASSANG